tara:strand:+ start:342 stop:644 length:303 start_codon:yes stop_codon:yes gene_type:complete
MLFITPTHKKNMALTKTTKTDKIETVAIENHYVLQCRDRISVLEDGKELSASFHRYVLNPDADVSTITDDVVKAQFEAVMTQEVKDNYAKFLKEQEVPSE